MGAGASSMTLPALDKEAFRQMAPDHYTLSLFNSLKDKDGTIPPARLSQFSAAATDCFLTHDWGKDELGRDNHARVGKLNALLKAKGFRTWFDEEMMRGNIQQQMADGIDHASCVIVFVTERYMNKVAGKGEKGELDNCLFEFSHLSNSKAKSKIFPVVMEPRCRDTSGWFGQVKFVLGSQLYTDYCSDDSVEAVADGLCNQMRQILSEGRTTNERLSSIVSASSQQQRQQPVETPTTSSYTTAATKIDTGSLFSRGMDHYNAEDYINAVAMFTQAAELDHAEAQYKLGMCYKEGLGVPQDDERAVHWLRIAADQAHTEAIFTLAMCYLDGIGVEKDEVQAVVWFTKAAEKGHAAAQDMLGNCYLNEWGVSKDYNQVVFWFQKAAEQGGDSSQCSLGTCYYNGWGVIRDYRKAVSWFTKAADQGSVIAMYSLGTCYANGWGVAKDETKAFSWYKKAADMDHTEARYCLGQCYLFGDGVNPDPAEAIFWSQSAADEGHAAAQYFLGCCYRDAVCVAEDIDKAKEWFDKAAEQGHEGAIRDLALL